MPASVLAVAVPPIVMPGPGLAVSVPSAMASVIVSESESMSANGSKPSAGQTRFVATFFCTVKAAGTIAVGASLTGVIAIWPGARA